MLNKLLKRCMPWMARGRWYHVGVIKTETESKVVCDDIFQVTTFDDTTLEIAFKKPGVYVISDAKCSATPLDDPGWNPDKAYIVYLPNNEILYHSVGADVGDVLEIPVSEDPMFKWDYWFYVTR